MNNDTPKASNLGRLFLILVIAVVVIAGALYLLGRYSVPNKDNKSSQTASQSGGWQHYKSTKYAIQFDYLSSWGRPQLQELKLAQGKQYSITFAKSPPNNKLSITVLIDTNNASKKVCTTETKCQTIPPITSSYIQQQINKGVKSVAAKNDNSFAVISENTKNGNSYTLTEYKMVDLTNINASAAVGYYAVSANHRCSTATLSSNSAGCISQNIYNELDKLLSSIKKV